MHSKVGRLAISLLLAVHVAVPRAVAQTPQQRFETASTATALGRCTEGLAAFEALEATDAVRNSPSVRATIAARRADCLVTMNRTKEGVAAAHIALTVLSEADPIGRDDLSLARLALGRAALGEFNFGQAKREFSEMLRLMAPDSPLPLMWLARATTFDGDGVAVDASSHALKAVQSTAKVDNKTLSIVKGIYARALLNQGQVAAAYTELKEVLKLRGGLTNKVDLNDVVLRSDLALAALLTKDNDEAREYLAYTGAGQFADSPFTLAARMEAPPCGEETGLRPEDRAVVEFAIDDEGSVVAAETVYTSRPGAGIAAAFGKAVKSWYWKPEDLAKIGKVFRAATRVELRCSTAAARPGIYAVARDELTGWLAERNVPNFDVEETGATLISSARKELAKRQAEGGGLKLVPVELALLGSALIQPQEKGPMLAESVKLLADAGAPISIRIVLEAIVSSDNPDDWRRKMEELLKRPDVAGDARASAFVRILLADQLKGQPDRKIELVGQVANNARLPDGDPYKVGALVRLANLEARAGKLEAAQAHFSRTGLDAQQCALADARPARKTTASSSLFPQAALRWGFEGWALLEFDIKADGGTANQRPIIAYPPLVFSAASVDVIKAMRYESTFRPPGVPGCGGASDRVVFGIPKY